MEDRPHEGPALKSWLVVQLDVVLFDDRGPYRSLTRDEVGKILARATHY